MEALLVWAAAVSPSEPLWSSIPKAIGPAVTATVAIVVAVAGYFKFIRGHTFQPRLTLTLDADVVRLDSKPALRINVTIKNDGLTAVVLDPCYAQRVDVFVADRAVWEDAVASEDGGTTSIRAPASVCTSRPQVGDRPWSGCWPPSRILIRGFNGPVAAACD